MIYSAACMYGIRAMCWLAIIRPDGNVMLDELCDGTTLPRHFVGKILQQLVRAELLFSKKGRHGGFMLARPAATIRLYDIVAAIDGVERFELCSVGLEKCDSEQPCPLHDQWSTVRDGMKALLENTTLEQMANTLQQKLDLIN